MRDIESLTEYVNSLPPVPDEDEIMLHIRSILRTFANDRQEPITPRERQSTDGTHALHIVVKDDTGWEVEYVANEFSSGYGESGGPSPTLVEAFRTLKE